MVIDNFLKVLNDDLKINGGNCKVEPNAKSGKNTPAKVGLNGKEAALIDDNYKSLTDKALIIHGGLAVTAPYLRKYMTMHKVSVSPLL